MGPEIMTNLKQELSYLMLGQQGGKNRIKILERLNERSYNTNQLATILDLNYRTVKHHLDVLKDHDLIESSGGDYGEVFFLSPRLEENFDLIQDMKTKIETVLESPELYEKIVNQTHDGIIILDENKDITFLNRSAKRITGYESDEALGKNVEHLLVPNIQEVLEEIKQKNEFIETTMKIETKSGKTKTVVITMDYFYFDGEEHKGASLLLRDITEKERHEEILQALMDHSEIIMAYLNPDFDLVYVNSAYAQETEHTPEELIGKNHFDLFPNEESKKIFKKVLEEEESVFIEDKDPLNPDGSNNDNVHWSLEPVKDSEEDVRGLVLSLCEHP